MEKMYVIHTVVNRRVSLLPIILMLVLCLKHTLALTSAAHSVISGSGAANFVALSPRTVTVTAKDSSGINTGVGGDLFYIQITNECTRTSNFDCTAVGGADNTITSSVFAEMTDNNDGTYSYTWTPDNEGKLSISAILMNRYSILGTYYSTVDLTGAAALTNYSSTIDYNWENYEVLPGQGDYVSSTYDAYIKAPVTGSITFYLFVDNQGAFWVDGVQKFNSFGTTCVCTYTSTISMTKDKFYHIKVAFAEETGGAQAKFYWSYTGQAQIIVPSTAFYYPNPVGAAVTTVTVSCPTGYVGTNSSSPNVCTELCGDSKRVGNEVCDDGDTSNTNGCSSDCRSIRTSWVCKGGNVLTVDTCTECTSGWYQNNSTTPTDCVSLCGDGKEVGTEACDDGNTINGDGCNGDCSSVESGWVCSGGSATGPDTCTKCAPGYHQNSPSAPTTCVTRCGDGFEAGLEKCDDGNTASSDGCLADCTSVEAGWVCSGGSPTTADTCTQCSTGFYQNVPTNPETCVTRCGDQIEAGAEKCDDGNTVSGDGCLTDCTAVEAGWVCIGGGLTSKDTCTKCADGFYQNDATNPEICVTICGDGLEAGTEKCDDGNVLSGDGCLADCSSVEAQWVCIGGSPTSKDVCTKCGTGWKQNNSVNPETCVEICGDGLRVGTEVCDDSNIIAGDGCSIDCRDIEDEYICYGGSVSHKDSCKTCPKYYKPDSDQHDCIPKYIGGYALKMAIIYLCFTFTGILFNSLTAITSNYCYQSIFSIINQVQIVLLIPLIGVAVPESVVDFNRVVSFCLASFSPITEHFIPLIFDSVKDHLYDPQIPYLYLIELNSGSTIFNLTGLITVVLVLLIAHGFIYICNDLTLDKSTESNYMKFHNLLTNYMTFGVYIRLFLLAYLYLLLSTVSEMKHTNNSRDHSSSYAYACIILGLLMLTTIMIFIKWLKTTKESDMEKIKYTRELFGALKETRLARSYYPMFLLRRLLFVLVIFNTVLDYSIVKVSLICAIQVAYLIYIIATRPFARVKDNAGEILNEVSYTALVVIVLTRVDSDDWPSISLSIYWGVLLGSNILFTCIAIGGFISGLITEMTEKDAVKANFNKTLNLNSTTSLPMNTFKSNHNLTIGTMDEETKGGKGPGSPTKSFVSLRQMSTMKTNDDTIDSFNKLAPMKRFDLKNTKAGIDRLY